MATNNGHIKAELLPGMTAEQVAQVQRTWRQLTHDGADIQAQVQPACVMNALRIRAHFAMHTACRTGAHAPVARRSRYEAQQATAGEQVAIQISHSSRSCAGR